MTRRRAGIVAGAALVAWLAVWVPATPALAAQDPSKICLPVLLTCPTSSPSPSPTPSPTTSDPGIIGGIVGGIIGGVTGSGGSGSDDAQLPLTLDKNAPIFTQPAAQLGGSSLSISGLHSVNIVQVRTIDGTRVPVIRIIADQVSIDDFMLDVRHDSTGPAAVNTSDRMVVTGNVHVYVQSLTATLPGGLGLSLLAPTPIPGDELPPKLLRVNLGLVGVTANSISFQNSDLRLHTGS